MNRTQLLWSCLVFLASAAAGNAAAVRLDPEGGGQALIYPYYTVRSLDGNPYNTYVSVVNATQQGKVLRVRLREGKAGVEVAGFNLYLSPNDTWTAAVVPEGAGARMLTRDTSCTNPAFSALAADANARFVDFTDAGYATDGLGTGLDRTNEGYIEILEMGTLTGQPLAAITPPLPGAPRTCVAMQGTALAIAGVQPPTGGLQGTATLINVTSGMDMTVAAEALADLATAPYYRNYNDPYPDFNAAEITPVSHIISAGKGYRLAWSTGVQAIASVFMQKQLMNEYVLDSATQSLSDWIVAFPTRRLQVVRGVPEPPFTSPGTPSAPCEQIGYTFFNREIQVATPIADDFATRPPSGPPPAFCHAATTIAFENGAAHVLGRSLLGSSNRFKLTLQSTFQNGWLRVTFDPLSKAPLASLPASTSLDLRTGARASGSFRLSGLPVVGFMARSYRNGTLTCATAGACQGNYGSAFSHQASRLIEPAP